MKKFLFSAVLLSCLTMAASLTGCSSDDDMIEQPAVKRNKLSISAYLQKVDGTKAEHNAWVPQDELGLFVKAGGISSNDYGEVDGQVKATYNNSKWTLAPEVSLSTTPAYVFAYYPHSNAVNDGVAVPVEVASQTDYLYSGSGVSASAERAQVALNMKHALCVMSFNVKKNGYIGGEGRLTSVVIRNKSNERTFATAGTLNISTGVITKTVYDQYEIQTSKVIEQSGWTKDFPLSMVIPFQTASTSKVEFVFTIDGKQYIVDVPKNMNFASGQKYLFNLTVKSESMDLDNSNITIEPWGTETQIELDDVMSKAKKFTYTIQANNPNVTYQIANVDVLEGYIDWGDNSPVDAYSASKTHSYSAAGTYNLSVLTKEDIYSASLAVGDLVEADFSEIM